MDKLAVVCFTMTLFFYESFLNNDFYTSSHQEPCLLKAYLGLRCTTTGLRQRARTAAYVIRAYLEPSKLS